MLTWLPFFPTSGKFAAGQIDFKRAFFRINADYVAVLQQPNRPPDCGLRPDMTDAKSAGPS